jgi:hypothetical protein
MNFIERENEIFRTLANLIETNTNFIIVGGYAVSGLAKHRFSVDCDLVVPETNLTLILNNLSNQGFTKEIEKSGFDMTYGEEFMNFKKNVQGLPIKIDLLINSLVCRNTSAAWSYEYLDKFSLIKLIPGIEMSISSRIPEKELLIAVKIHSGRKTDIRDIIMLNENVNIKRLIAHVKRGNLEKLNHQLNTISNTLADPNLIHSLKGVFSLSEDVSKQIESTQKMINYLITNLFDDEGRILHEKF